MEKISLNIILSLAAIWTCAYCKLPCQTEVTRPTAGRFRDPTASTPDGESVPSVSALRSARRKPDLCCGPKPFNTGLRTCCLGRLVLKSTTRCCLSGTPVPRGVDCACDPHSGWIRHQSDQLRALDIRYRSLAEVMEDAKTQLIAFLEEKEVLVKELDSLQTSLWRDFLKEIGIARSQDPEEVQYIYDLVTFLHSHEQISDEELEENQLEEVEFGHGLDASNDQKTKLRKVLRQLLSRNKGIIQRMIARSPSNGNNNNVVHYTTNGDSSSDQDEEILWIETYRKALLPVAKQELEENLESNEEEVERIIIERNKILKQVTRENDVLFAGADRLKLLENVIKRFLIDLRLISTLRELLDSFLDEVMEKEDEMLEEEEFERETEETEEGRTGPKTPSVEHSGCDVSRWTTYITNFTDRADAARADFRDMLDPDASIQSNKRANDPVPQQRSLLSNFLEKHSYNLKLLKLTRLAKAFGLENTIPTAKRPLGELTGT